MLGAVQVFYLEMNFLIASVIACDRLHPFFFARASSLLIRPLGMLAATTCVVPSFGFFGFRPAPSRAPPCVGFFAILKSYKQFFLPIEVELL